MQQEQPNQAAAQPENQKAFADLLYTMMNVIENFQEGETGEGNYLIAMNALRDLHKFKQQLSAGGGAGVVYHHYVNMARAPAPPPARARAARKKLSEDEKRAAGYVTCLNCGRLFSEGSKLRRHQETTEICRYITNEKQVAVATKSAVRAVEKHVVGRKAQKIEKLSFITAPDDHCLTKKHPFFGAFMHSLLLFIEGRQEVVLDIKLEQMKKTADAYIAETWNITDTATCQAIRKSINKKNYYDAYKHSIHSSSGDELLCGEANLEFCDNYHHGSYITFKTRQILCPQTISSPTPSMNQEMAMLANETPEFSPTGSPALSPEDAHAMEILMHYAIPAETAVTLFGDYDSD